MEYTIALILSVASKAGMSYAVAQMYLDRPPHWIACFRKGFSKFCDVFCAMFLVNVGLVVANVIFSMLMSLLLEGHNILLNLLVFVFYLAWAVVNIYVLVPLMLVVPIVVVEQKGPVEAVRRCWNMSWDHRCYIFCTVFCLTVIYYLFIIIMALLMNSIGGPELAQSLFGTLLRMSATLVYLPLVTM